MLETVSSSILIADLETSFSGSARMIGEVILVASGVPEEYVNGCLTPGI